MLKIFSILPGMLVILFKKGYYSIILLFIIIISLLASFFFYSHFTISFPMTSRRHKRAVPQECPHPCPKCPYDQYKHTQLDGRAYCLDECFPNFHTITSREEGNSCVRCEDSNCDNCDGTRRRCTKCRSGYYLLHDGKCNLTCPASTFHHKLKRECLHECPEPTLYHDRTCVEDCPLSTYRLNNRCVHTCPAGFKPNKRGKKCISKRGKCKLSPWQRFRRCHCRNNTLVRTLARFVISGHCGGRTLKKLRKCHKHSSRSNCHDSSSSISSNPHSDRRRQMLGSHHPSHCRNCQTNEATGPNNSDFLKILRNT